MIDILQAGKIRLALFLPQFARNPLTGALRGIGTGLVAMEMVRALAARLHVQMQLIEQPSPHSAMESLKAGACDVVFLGIEPSRLAEVDFSPPVVQFDYTYLVPAGSSIQCIVDADRSKVRIAVVKSHASALALSRLVKHAELVGAELPDAAFDLLRTGRADAFALPREQLVDYSSRLPGSLVLDEAYGVNRVGMALAKGQAGRLAYITDFVEEAKASGLIQRVLENRGLRDFQVSPREGADTK